MNPQNERRKEPRLITSTPVTITVLGTPPQDPICGQLLNISGSGMLLRLPQAVPANSPVKIEGNDALFLGEVCRCDSDADRYLVAVQVRHSLGGLAQLERLNAQLLGFAPVARHTAKARGSA